MSIEIVYSNSENLRANNPIELRAYRSCGLLNVRPSVYYHTCLSDNKEGLSKEEVLEKVLDQFNKDRDAYMLSIQSTILYNRKAVNHNITQIDVIKDFMSSIGIPPKCNGWNGDDKPSGYIEDLNKRFITRDDELDEIYVSLHHKQKNISNYGKILIKKETNRKVSEDKPPQEKEVDHLKEFFLQMVRMKYAEGNPYSTVQTILDNIACKDKYLSLVAYLDSEGNFDKVLSEIDEFYARTPSLPVFESVESWSDVRRVRETLLSKSDKALVKDYLQVLSIKQEREEIK